MTYGSESECANHYTTARIPRSMLINISSSGDMVILKLKVEVNYFEICIADRKATTCIQAKLFLLRCVNSTALPHHSAPHFVSSYNLDPDGYIS